jgi:hypothetical protein
MDTGVHDNEDPAPIAAQAAGVAVVGTEISLPK